jgi:hypothetical protein
VQQRLVRPCDSQQQQVDKDGPACTAAAATSARPAIVHGRSSGNVRHAVLLQLLRAGRWGQRCQACAVDTRRQLAVAVTHVLPSCLAEAAGA